jgi:rhamnosyltransferase
MATRVSAIVVTYHPGTARLAALLDAIAGQVDGVVIVDNGSPEVRAWLVDAARERGCELLLLEKNTGVAAAHNIGIARARALGADSVLLLDQDSLPQENMVAALEGALRELARTGELVAAVGPCHMDRRSRAQSPFIRFGLLFNRHLYCGGKSGDPFIECDHLITSGSLIPAASFDRVGELDERLFVDTVDTEWCFRAQYKGYKLFGVCSAEMGHAVGEGSVATWVPFADDVVVHGPNRLYYIIRNHIILYKRAYIPRRWVFQDFPRILFKAVVFSTAIRPRRANLAMMVRGFWDGVRGSTGALANG